LKKTLWERLLSRPKLKREDDVKKEVEKKEPNSTNWREPKEDRDM